MEMKWSRRRRQQDPGKPTANEDVDFQVQETTAGEIIVTLPTGEVYVYEPDAERASWRENVLAEKFAATVAREVATQLKRASVLPASGASELSVAENFP